MVVESEEKTRRLTTSVDLYDIEDNLLTVFRVVLFFKF